VQRRQARAAGDAARGSRDGQTVKSDEAQEQKLKAQVLESQLNAQGDANSVADDKQTLAALGKEVSGLKRDVQKEKMKVSEADSKLKSKETQVKDEQARSRSALDSPQLEALKAKEADLAKAMQSKAAELRGEQQQGADAKQADAALSEQQKAVDARLRRVKSVAKSENAQIEELGKGLQNHKKKEQVLAKVQQSWEASLTSNEEAAVKEKSQKTHTAHEVAKLERQDLAAQQEDTAVEMARERKAIKLEQAVKAVSNHLKLAQQETDKIKAKESKAMEKLEMTNAQITHYSKKMEELRERKRMLVQSKLDDLEKKDTPFHAEGVQAMDKMAEANQLRADDMKKTEAIVKAAQAKSEAPA